MKFDFTNAVKSDIITKAIIEDLSPLSGDRY